MGRQPGLREQKDKRGAARIVGIQAGTTALVALALLPIAADFALAWLLGGSIAAAGNGWFTMKVFGRPVGEDPEKELGRMFSAEIGKFLIIFTCFALVFKEVEPMRNQLNALVLLVAFVMIYMQTLIAPRLMQWTGAYRTGKKPPKRD